MKAIQTAFRVMLVGMAISFGYAQENDAVKKDTATLQGEWSMVSGSADGQPMPTPMLNQMKRICRGNEVTTAMAGRTFFKAKITIDPSKTPKTIDYEMTEGFTKGKKQLGIYELNGDTFKSCFGKPDAERPTDFSSKPGDGRTLSVWKRETPQARQKIQSEIGQHLLRSSLADEWRAHKDGNARTRLFWPCSAAWDWYGFVLVILAKCRLRG